MHKLLGAVANSGLVVVAVALLAGPLLLGQLLSTSESGALGAMTAADPNAVATGPFTVYPNITDFTAYAQFAPHPMTSAGFYQTEVTFTAFAGQEAAYTGLLTVSNPTNKPVTVVAEAGNLSTALADSYLRLSLSDSTRPDAVLLTSAAEAGQSQLRLASTAGFSSGQVVVNNQSYHATSPAAGQLTLATPLTTAAEAGDTVYLGAAFFAKGAVTPTTNQTRPLTIAPRQTIAVNLSVATESGDQATAQTVVPVVVRVAK